MKNKTSTVINLILSILVVIISIIACLSVFGNNVLFSVIDGDSMSTTLNNGDLVLLSKVKSNEIKLNDFVLLDFQSFSVIHRVVGYKYKENNKEVLYYYKTGDNEKVSNVEIISFITRGDKYTDDYGTFSDYSISQENKNVHAFDEYVDVNLIRYKVVKVYKKLGNFVNFIKKPINLLIFVILPILILYSIIISEIAVNVYKYKKENKSNE